MITGGVIMVLIEKKDYNRQVKIIMVLGVIVGLAWGFCAGMLFKQYCQQPGLPAPIIILKGIEF